ncbi:MAG: DUF2871 domain-containing protein [Clostridiales bacterium]|nr:DUF2871 domain-containing protein [Clostridiales bacterium]
MKKLINRAFAYLIAALLAGVFYREFTKFRGFTGKTTLAVIHPHLLVLGSLLLLVAALFCLHLPLIDSKHFKTFQILHTIGLPFMALTMQVRGIVTVAVAPQDLSRGLDAGIAGIAGISHLVMAAALVYFFLALKAGIKARPAD